MPSLELPIEILAPDGTLVAKITNGAAEGTNKPTLWWSGGDFVNVRNIQGNPNLDLGGGSDGIGGPRGNIVCNWDVGNATNIYDGRKNLLLSVNPKNDHKIHANVPIYMNRAYIKRTDGTWRRL